MIMRRSSHFCIACVVGMGLGRPVNYANTLTAVIGCDADPLGFLK